MLNKKILKKNKLYILGVSGGPDSMFLLDSMRKGGYNLIAVHLNYQKRAESQRDENIVREYCQKYSLSVEVELAKSPRDFPKRNFQDWARQVRYNFFQEIAQKYQTEYLAVAHHQDDHLETYLLQKRRNSLVDYWGLSSCAKWGQYWILRPLLKLTKKQIIHHLAEKKIPYALDKTNELPIYQRNILRQKLDNLTAKRKKLLLREIREKNQELTRKKKIVNSHLRKFIPNPSIFQLKKEDNFSSEIYLRLLYFWINKFTSGILQQRKKKLLTEIYKQLFISKKTNLVINLGEFRISKYKNYAVIQTKNN